VGVLVWIADLEGPCLYQCRIERRLRGGRYRVTMPDGTQATIEEAWCYDTHLAAEDALFVAGKATG
jgi:hypothetical protein